MARRVIVYVMQLDKEFRSRVVSAEVLVAYAFTKRGYAVAIPFSAYQPYDLLVDVGTRIIRVQVKSARFMKAVVRPNGYKGDRARWGADLIRKSGKKVPLAAFDYAAVVCGDDVYVIPTEMLKADDGKSFINKIHIKPAAVELTRADSRSAVDKWESYRNNFDIGTPSLY